MQGRKYRKKTPGGLWVPGDGEPIDRRQFVQAASGIALATGLDACSSTRDGPPTGPADKGFLHGIITGLDASVTSGGSVTGNRTDITGTTPVTVPSLPANGDLTVEVDVGTYTLDYTPPTGHTLALNETNPKNDVVVTKGNTTDVTWAVVVADATVSVVVSGLAQGGADGGTVEILRTDLAGQSAVTSNVPPGGQVDVGVIAGTYQVTYTAPSGFKVNSTNPLSVSVVSGATGTAAFTVVASGVGGGPGDIYNHGFEDSTAGSFVAGNFTTLIIGGLSPWKLDTTGAPRNSGTSVKSLMQTYLATPNNVGVPFYFVLPSGRKSVYVRFACMFSVGFNGNADNEQKVLRFETSTFFQQGTLIVGGLKTSPAFRGQFLWKWDNLNNQYLGVPNLSLPTLPNTNNLQGQWIWVEVFVDVSVATALHVMIWINGTLYYDLTTASLATAPPPLNYGILQFDGTVNSMANDSTFWIDEIGVSSQPMGIP